MLLVGVTRVHQYEWPKHFETCFTIGKKSRGGENFRTDTKCGRGIVFRLASKKMPNRVCGGGGGGGQKYG